SFRAVSHSLLSSRRPPLPHLSALLLLFLMIRHPPISPLFPYTTLFRSDNAGGIDTETIASVLDYTIRVSSREAYVSPTRGAQGRSEEHTSELQSLTNLVCRLLLEKKKKINTPRSPIPTATSF